MGSKNANKKLKTPNRKCEIRMRCKESETSNV